MLSVSVEGDGALAARFAAMPAAVQAALRAKAASLAQALSAHVKQDKLSGQVLQVRSGALRDSIGAEVTDDGASILARVFSDGDVKYAAIQEYGGRTPAHDIAPVKAKALAFMIGGKQVFARIVHHPGSTIPARSYLGSALAGMGAQIIAEMNATVIDALSGQGDRRRMIAREDIFQALFALTEGVLWGAPARGFIHRARRVALWDDLPAQPALCQAEHNEEVAETTGLPPVTNLSASWLIYHDVGKDPAAIPARETNLILDAVQALFPAGEPDQVQTLGGLVHHCFISGKLFKDPGDLDGQALIIVPITILAP